MKIKKFIDGLNKTPLLKRYTKEHGNITMSVLKKVNFVKKDYMELQDLLELTKLLTGFTPPIIPKRLQGKKEKDIYHAKGMEIYDNLKLISDYRKILEIPSQGFQTKSRFARWIAKDTNDFQYIKNSKKNTTKFCRIQYTDNPNKIKNPIILEKKVIREEALEIVIDEILSKWKLPKRYKDAIQELLLYNRIIPADTGTSWVSVDLEWGNKKIRGVAFDKDATKEKIITHLKKDNSTFKKLKKDLSGKAYRTSRETKNKKNIIDFYNRRKEQGAKDKDIYREISLKYGVSAHAVRKRIKGK